ncbi:YcxB family protein [Robertmurraya beringensis]|uniref:YcxB family protein n=1 Tax=Robertmurraya beringensis TaxID=641660 RepID=A0ABV6KSQ4_9BACI
MRLSEEGIVDESVNGQTKVNWAGVVDVKEDEHNLYIYNSAVSAYILPKRNYPSLKILELISIQR